MPWSKIADSRLAEIAASWPWLYEHWPRRGGADHGRPLVVRSPDHVAAPCRARGPLEPVDFQSRPARSGRSWPGPLLSGRHQRFARIGRPRSAGGCGPSVRRVGRDLACRGRCRTASCARRHRPGGRFLGATGTRAIAAAAADLDARIARGRRLDRHALAGNDGKRRAQRLPGRRSDHATPPAAPSDF